MTYARDMSQLEGRVRVPHEEGDNPRWFLSYTFYKLDPAWRRLPPEQRERHKDELAELIEGWCERMVVRTFSTVGLRPDCDIMLWRATPRLELLQQMQVDVSCTELGTYLQTAHLYTATTKGSQYAKDVKGTGVEKPKPLDVVPVDRRYLIVYPMDKQRPWYALPREQRGTAMREHALVGREYPGVKINTAYSFGIDDQEFMVAFETDSVHDFLDLMHELRGTEASQYTLRDTPIFTCVRTSAREMLDTLGGVGARIAVGSEA